MTRLLATLRSLLYQLAECWRLLRQDNSRLDEIEDKYGLF